ncbi:hypothetical protein DICSQDRAFT_171422 [Dichomitus squalens LYAD-421 SS1]|uniref:Beta-glucuronidase C-terminal domain-containing protein n=1 Tax=Dichomitus squalens (strain LYAD-421) TaxID=732165 RepID=R7SVY2_DICSQ|nr:uncharacterized protein DICSQDRAFT_171422 [Dichomitus squalens LYAD-421 SS1]EJF60196.1 hypothetical protein DICSQDRAFT_171422 [Dichomitus squalens LYAD-421 SS1]
MPKLSIPHKGDFFGFSIEMSVVQQVIGKNASFLQPTFLNLLATVADRAGSVRVRIGGNTQEIATLVASLPENAMIAKDHSVDDNAPTQTPTLDLTDEFLYLFANVSSLVNAKWYLGIPMNDTSHLRLQIAEHADAILGSNVLGYQVGNEPDLYGQHGLGGRPKTYNQTDYFNEFGTMVNGINNDPQIASKNKIVAPSLQGTWTPESLWDIGYLNTYSSFLDVISVEHYPEQNCAAAFPGDGLGPIINPQDVFADYLTHASGQSIVQPYLNSAGIAQQYDKDFMMFETNTASCGGFAGVSDSFGSALWAVDYGLQMAYSNFSGAMLHIGGQNVSYNPFTPPPTNLSLINKWTVGPIMYSTLFLAEALGTTNTSRVVDLAANNGSEFTPGFAIYENDALARVALVNFMTEQNGQGAYNATISIGGSAVGESNAVPAQVRVKYLLAPSVAEKNQVTWANQTFGGRFAADGRLSGNEVIQTISCDQNANTCVVPVPAPGAALVFVSSDAQSSSDPSATQTYATTAVTNPAQNVNIDPTALANSNGRSGGTGPLAGTSKGGANGAGRMSGSLSLGLCSILACLFV